MTESEKSLSYSQALISLMKGIVYRDEHAKAWQTLLDQQPSIKEYAAVLGLELVLDETEGYAFLRQRIAGPGEEELYRLIPRRQLGFSVSLLLALLRKKLAEFDASSGDARLILRQEEIVNLVSVFLPPAANEARQAENVESDIGKIVKMGFLRKLRAQDDEFEVRRILKAFVDAQWLSDFNERLNEYRGLIETNQSVTA